MKDNSFVIGKKEFLKQGNLEELTKILNELTTLKLSFSQYSKKNLYDIVIGEFTGFIPNIFIRCSVSIKYSVASFSEWLRTNNSVTCLELQYHEWNEPKDAMNVSYALKGNSTLTSLNLKGNSIDCEKAEYMAEALQINCTLKELNLCSNNMREKGVQHISHALLKNITLTKLDLSFNAAGGKGASHLRDVLLNNSVLTYLNLDANNIGEIGAKYISEGLQQNNALTYLNLDRNNIGEIGAKYISEGLQQNNALTYLNLKSNNIGLKGTTYISQLLITHNTTLRILILNNNYIGDEGANLIAQILKKNNTLLCLTLGNNNIGDIGANDIANSLKVNNTLNFLYLSNSLPMEDNKINGDDNSSLYYALKCNYSLFVLGITHKDYIFNCPKNYVMHIMKYTLHNVNCVSALINFIITNKDKLKEEYNCKLSDLNNLPSDTDGNNSSELTPPQGSISFIKLFNKINKNILLPKTEFQTLFYNTKSQEELYNLLFMCNTWSDYDLINKNFIYPISKYALPRLYPISKMEKQLVDKFEIFIAANFFEIGAVCKKLGDSLLSFSNEIIATITSELKWGLKSLPKVSKDLKCSKELIVESKYFEEAEEVILIGTINNNVELEDLI